MTGQIINTIIIITQKQWASEKSPGAASRETRHLQLLACLPPVKEVFSGLAQWLSQLILHLQYRHPMGCKF